MHWAHFASAACFAAIAFRVCACAPVIWLWMNYRKKVGELLVASATVRALLCESSLFWMNYKVRCVTHDKSLVKIALLPHGGITRSRRSFSRKRTQGHKADTHSRAITDESPESGCCLISSADFISKSTQDGEGGRTYKSRILSWVMDYCGKWKN